MAQNVYCFKISPVFFLLFNSTVVTSMKDRGKFVWLTKLTSKKVVNLAILPLTQVLQRV